MTAMHPLKHHRQKLQQGVSRARMLLRKHMGWLPGFPVQADADSIQWRSFSWNEAGNDLTSLNGEHLRRMEFALTQLRHHFPHALPKIVPDVEGWLLRMDQILVVLKEVIHHQGRFEPVAWSVEELAPRRWGQQFGKLYAEHPLLRPLLEAVLFIEMTGLPQPSLQSLRWIDDRAPFLCSLASTNLPGGPAQSLDLQLKLCTLRNEMPPNLQARLFEYLSDEALWQLPSRGCFAYAQKLSTQLLFQIDQSSTFFEIPTRPVSQSLGHVFQDLLQTLTAVKPKVRRQLALLWEYLLPENWLSQARELSLQVKQEESRLLNLLCRYQTGQEMPTNKKERKALKRNAHVAIPESIPRVLEPIEYAVERMESFSRSPLRIEAWLDFFRCHSNSNNFPWATLFQRWEKTIQRLRAQGRPADRKFRPLMEDLCNALRRHGPSEVLLSHWQKCAESQNTYRGEFFQELLEDTSSQPTFKRTIDLLEELVFVRKLSLGPGLLCSLVECVKATDNDGRAAQFITALAEQNDQAYHASTIQAALLTENEEDAVSVLQVLRGECDLVEPTTLLGKHIHDPRLRKIIRRAILEKEEATLLRLARCTKVVTVLGQEVPQLPDEAAPTAWLAEYPADFHEELRILHSMTSNAAPIAEKILAKDFPKPARLRREIETLRHRLRLEPDEIRRGNLIQRIENLTRHGETSPALSPRRLSNLKTKLRRRAEWELVEQYNRECHHLALDNLKRKYDCTMLPAAIFQTPYPELLTGILDLGGEMREQGLRLLLQSFEDSDWSFADDPKNFAFQAQLESQGIHMKPWIGSGYEVAARTKSGEPYHLRFTRRILDFLLMGFHFETCLAPDSFNFFSTIANALDLNKQVVYGKTGSGRVIGRCLFALTQEGMILTYHRYAHEEGESFAAAVEVFAEGLARAMKTTIASTGTVPNLAAREWYDDGAEQIESKWNLHAEDSPLRVLLRNGEPHTLIDQLRERIGYQVAMESMLDSLLKLEEFQKRPEILPPFVDRFGLDECIPFRCRFRLAVLARSGGNLPAAKTILDSFKQNEIVTHLRRSECSSYNAFYQFGGYADVVDLLNDYNPTLALRVLRGTRAEHVKRDEQECDSTRRKALAQIHRRLGRNLLAEKLAQRI